MVPRVPTAKVPALEPVPEIGHPRLSVVMIDASCFSLPYDHCLCEALTRAGCEVTLVCSDFVHANWNLDASFTIRKDFYQWTNRLLRQGRARKIRQLAKAAEHAVGMRRLTNVLRGRKPDVIHFQWLPAPLIDNLYMGELSQIAPLLFTLHNTGSLIHDSSVPSLQRLKSVFRHFSGIIVHSQFSKTRAIENGWVGKDRLHVIPHGVLDYYTKFPRDNPPAAEAGHTVLFFGAIEHYKGLDLLVRAFAKLPLHILSVSTLMVIGKPGIRMEPIRRLAASLGVGHRIVWKLRFVEEWEVASAFNSATVIALPYRDIDQSGVLMTALAFDKPVVATAIGAIPETIQNGVHGYLVPPNDVEALAAALERILRDPQIRASMEEAVRLRHRDLCWDNIARRTNEIYSAVLLGSKEIPEMPCAF